MTNTAQNLNSEEVREAQIIQRWLVLSGLGSTRPLALRHGAWLVEYPPALADVTSAQSCATFLGMGKIFICFLFYRHVFPVWRLRLLGSCAAPPTPSHLSPP